MKSRSSIHEYARTKYVQLDTRKCKACWKCLDICSNNVIDRINLPFHKHARIINSINCKGSLKCFNVCEYNALSKVSIT
jgi:2-oxoglutarate ferredoxin oxidoreductase subunit delta